MSAAPRKGREDEKSRPRRLLPLRLRKMVVVLVASAFSVSKTCPRKACFHLCRELWRLDRLSTPTDGEAIPDWLLRATNIRSLSSAVVPTQRMWPCRVFIASHRCSNGGCLAHIRVEFSLNISITTSTSSLSDSTGGNQRLVDYSSTDLPSKPWR